MSYHQQMLYLSDTYGRPVEIFNGARLTRNLTTAGDCAPFSGAISNAGCDGLLYRPGCPDVLAEAILWLDAEDGNPTQQTAPNRGWGGPLLNATLGAATSVGTDEPLWLGGTGNYLYTPAITGNTATTPNTAALQITGDIEIIARLALDDWTPSATQSLVSKYTSASNGYELRINTSGVVQGVFRLAASDITVSASVANTFVDGSTHWLRMTRASASGNVNFYYADDTDDNIPTVWIQLGTANVAGTSGAITSGTAVMTIGETSAAGNPAAAKFYRVAIRNAIGATTPVNVMDVDFTAWPSTTAAQTSYVQNGYTWTINRSSTGRKSVVYIGRPLWLFGADDYMTTADADIMDFALNESFTVMAVYRPHYGSAPAAQRIFGKHTATAANAGWDLSNANAGTATVFTVGDGAVAPAATAPTRVASTISVVVGVRNTTTDQLTAYSTGVAGTPATDTTTATSVNSVTIDYGRTSTGAQFLEAEAFAFLVWKRALTSTEVAEVSRYYAASPTVAGYNWTSVDFTTNPWSNGSTAATEAYGFWVEEWTGLDGAHQNRATAATGSRRGGGTFGPMTGKHRVMKMNVLLHGSSERGLQYLFEWLQQQLMNCCDPCGAQTGWIREFCPSDVIANPNEGVVKLERVSLIEGLTWESPPVKDAGCYLRRVSFTIASTDPCFYRDAPLNAAGVASWAVVVPQQVASFAPASCAKWAGTSVRITGDLDVPQYGSAAPILRIISPAETTGATRKALPVMRLAGYLDPDLAGNPCTAPFLGELVLEGAASSGLELLVDMAQRRVLYRTTPGTGPWLDGSRFIGKALKPNVRRWWSAEQCGNAFWVFEPAYDNLLTNRLDSSSYTKAVSTWMVSASSGTRFSCC